MRSEMVGSGAFSGHPGPAGRQSQRTMMHQGWALGGLTFMILCSLAGSVAAEEKKPRNAIRVLEATYGGRLI